VTQSTYQLKSLASRVRGMHRALTADELAKLLGMSKVTILRREHSFVSCWPDGPLRPASNIPLADGARRAVSGEVMLETPI
jgi:hypothetical protein